MFNYTCSKSTSHHDKATISTSFKVTNEVNKIKDEPEPRSGFNSFNFFGNDIDWEKLKAYAAANNSV